jgi:hypothetical protein
MPTPTYTPLATVTLGTASASVTFSSIPATYRDLILVFRGTLTTATFNELELRINGDTGSNYTRIVAFGDGSGTGSLTDVFNSYRFSYGNNTNPFTSIVQFMDYSATDKHKTALSRSSTAANIVFASATRWANTAAVNTIRLAPNSGSFATGCTFALYGIVA